MKKVLIPTDFSENAMNAIRYASDLFKYERVEFTIMHAFADEVYDNNLELSRELFDEYKEKIKENSDRELQKIFPEIVESSPNSRHSYQFLSVFGSLVDAANDNVDKEDMELLVMGTRGNKETKEVTFGSNALQVMKYVKCPVLAIPSTYHETTPKHILLPTDFQIPLQQRELDLISDIASDFMATIHFLYISEFETLSFRQQDNKNLLESLTANTKKEFHFSKGKDIASAVNDFIPANNIDMLVMVNLRHSFLENIFYTSTIQKIGLQVKIPFMVLQNLPRY